MFETQIITIVGKVGVPLGPFRPYGQIGASYHDSKFRTTQTMTTLLAGIAGTTWGMFRAEQARQDAVSAKFAEAERREGERRAKEEAQKRLEQIEKATEILSSVFRDLDPMTAEQEGLILRDLLSRRLVEASASAERCEGPGVPQGMGVFRTELRDGNRGNH